MRVSVPFWDNASDALLNNNRQQTMHSTSAVHGRAQLPQGPVDQHPAPTLRLVVGGTPFCERLEAAFRGQGSVVRSVSSFEAALLHLRAHPEAIVLLDLAAPWVPGLEALPAHRAVAPGAAVIVLAPDGAGGTAAQALQRGATEVLSYPCALAEVQRAIARAAEQRARRLEGRRPPAPRDLPAPADLQVFFTHSEAMRRVKALIDQAAATDATVLVEGESGAGKSLVAYTLHGQSARGHRPLVKVNCTTLPGELLESELFGHERGAFTGAHRRKPGKFELAHEGTIFLDEVGELPAPLQAKLLQVLQDGEFARLGGERDLRVDVRVLAATNRQLAPAVAAGTFRADLYYRLNVVRIEVPPLRARREEIPILAEHFLRLYAARYNRPARRLAPETLALFLTYDWPGNVRELENLVKRIVVLEDEAGARGELAGGRADPAAPLPPEAASLNLKAAVRRAAREVERALIQEALQRTRWNRAEAARLLQISYKALSYKIRELDMLEGPA